MSRSASLGPRRSAESESKYDITAGGLRSTGTAAYEEREAERVARAPPLYFVLVEDQTNQLALRALDETVIDTAEISGIGGNNQVVHPQVHYIFIDDVDGPTYTSPYSVAASPGERVIIIDFADDAHTVVKATSLSSDWQVTKVDMSSLAVRSTTSTTSHLSGNSNRPGGHITAPDIGRKITIEGIGDSTANHAIIGEAAARARHSEWSSGNAGSQTNIASDAEVQLQNAITSARLFSDTNETLTQLIQEYPPESFTALVDSFDIEKLTAVVASTSESHLQCQSQASLHASVPRSSNSPLPSLTHINIGLQTMSLSTPKSESDQSRSESESDSESDSNRSSSHHHSDDDDTDQPMFATVLDQEKLNLSKISPPPTLTATSTSPHSAYLSPDQSSESPLADSSSQEDLVPPKSPRLSPPKAFS
ncbi:uncharacterized protein V1516DRAFT_682024 [Lipomyces oligophaga]|uniref:uncharacterized protein n=1 Tax=Lipomyces oligophaga TaxID=45792 RepID=UPI0034CD7C73